MRKTLTFGLSLAALALAAAASRAWQRAAAFEEGGLLTPGHPSTGCLLGVLAAAVIGFGLLSAWVTKGAELGSYLRAFSLPYRGLGAVYVLAGALLVAAGTLDLWEKSRGVELGLSRTILSVALLPTGVGMGLVGWLNGRREEDRGRFAWPLLLPSYCGCIWLIATYQATGTDPNVMRYAVSLLGAVCGAICCYAMAAFSFEKPMGRLTLWLGGVALTALGAMAVDCAADGARSELLVCLGYMLYLAVQVQCLAVRCERPAQLECWTPPAEEMENEVDENA